MSNAFLFALVGVGLFSFGFYALIMYVHLLRKILAVNVMGSGIFLVLVALAKRTDGALPDPVPHAMVLTGIVVAVSATALALILMVKVGAKSGQAALPNRHKE